MKGNLKTKMKPKDEIGRKKHVTVNELYVIVVDGATAMSPIGLRTGFEVLSLAFWPSPSWFFEDRNDNSGAGEERHCYHSKLTGSD